MTVIVNRMAGDFVEWGRLGAAMEAYAARPTLLLVPPVNYAVMRMVYFQSHMGVKATKRRWRRYSGRHGIKRIGWFR